MIVFTLPGERLVNESNAREFWTKRAARARRQRFTAAMHFNIARRDVSLPLPLVVTITRLGPGTLDDDAATISAKHVRDGIADALGLPGHDRNPEVTWVVKQERAKAWGVRVEIRRAA